MNYDQETPELYIPEGGQNHFPPFPAGLPPHSAKPRDQSPPHAKTLTQLDTACPQTDFIERRGGGMTQKIPTHWERGWKKQPGLAQKKTKRGGAPRAENAPAAKTGSPARRKTPEGKRKRVRGLVNLGGFATPQRPYPRPTWVSAPPCTQTKSTATKKKRATATKKETEQNRKKIGGKCHETSTVEEGLVTEKKQTWGFHRSIFERFVCRGVFYPPESGLFWGPNFPVGPGPMLESPRFSMTMMKNDDFFQFVLDDAIVRSPGPPAALYNVK
ncbi:hypothetical protein JTE90_029124 [Oedothorax gibbosus]|uniref:Uncharacterized protein n=1 Tax=Oedothorax gibbosus TaxID=931172 RepID=A0AAV6TFR3_9ARAC|nr:hypothetical protein JTE90_029124 [Oedothorax gibbosus]